MEQLMEQLDAGDELLYGMRWQYGPGNDPNSGYGVTYKTRSGGGRRYKYADGAVQYKCKGCNQFKPLASEYGKVVVIQYKSCVYIDFERVICASCEIF